MKNVMCCVVVGIALLVGCGDTKSEKSNDGNKKSESASRFDSATIIVEVEPKDAVPVGVARTNLKDGDDVVVVGRIGGSTEPFVSDLAAFTIVDSKVTFCPPEEGCPTPWDYCCTQNEVRENIATIKMVDAQQKLIATDAKELLGVKELSVVVVSGTAKRDDAGNLTILGNKLFVKSK